ncbi:NusA-like transcription termination signal-binding factor [Candidatus Parvarchaeota archaeon]|nr:NusA-like transcription termination signal-binding factor [Candidatus Parvarchaeota archaeon]
MSIKLDSETISSINVFSNVTAVFPRDCIIEPNRIIFVVNQGQAGMSIGKNGSKLKILESMFKKDVLVIEFSDDPVKFLENVLRPNKLISGYIATDNKDVKKLEASIQGRLSISKIKLAKSLMQRYFNIMSINIR